MRKRKAESGDRKKRGIQIRAGVAAEYGVSVPEKMEGGSLSPNEVGEILGVTGEAVKQWIYHRRLPAVKLSNGYWRVQSSDLERFLQARQEVGKLKILVAAGSDALPVVSETINELGHSSVIANGLADAVLKANDLRPNLLIIDITGWKEAWKLCETIRSSATTKHAAILLLSNRALSDDEIQRVLNLGAKGCLQLPVTKEVFAKEVGGIIGRS
jgi:CheY-like chemotaxis protein